MTEEQRCELFYLSSGVLYCTSYTFMMMMMATKEQCWEFNLTFIGCVILLFIFFQ